MPRVEFTPKLGRESKYPPLEVAGNSVREVLAESCRVNPELRSYLLDDAGRIRKHIVVFVDGVIVQDRSGWTDAVADDSTLFVMQALSTG